MAERIRNLEDALATLHSAHSKCATLSAPDAVRQDNATPTHPLLCGDVMGIKDLSEVYSSGLKQMDVREAYDSGDGANSRELISDAGHTVGDPISQQLKHAFFVTLSL